MDALQADVLIVGGGPAGLAAAIACRQAGVKRVTVVEREPQAGGVPRHCGHPPFGMREFGRILSGPAYAHRLRTAAAEAGVRICTDHHVVALKPGGVLRMTTPHGLVEASAARVLLATGAREASRAARLVSGQRPMGVMNTGALQAHLYLHGLVPFQKPVIVGTELVALSAIWSCVKAGIRPAAMLEEGHRPTAWRMLAGFPAFNGVPLHYGVRIVDIHGQSRVTHVTVEDATHQRRDIACDGVLFTGRFLPEASLVRASHLRLDLHSGGPVIDQHGRTSDPSYFAAGNLLRAVETAGWSFREGRAIGDRIARSLDREAGAALDITVGPGLKYVVPSMLRLDEPGGMTSLQLRVPRAIKGELVLKFDGQPVWRRKMSALPERRIVVPLPPLSTGLRSVWIGFIGAAEARD
ncbi:NAD(P)/FAD-dependent oxidoreductase [Achromobacter anxifer]